MDPVPEGLAGSSGLNEVRSWRPEQCATYGLAPTRDQYVSMKSGLGDRNNTFKGELKWTQLETSQ